MSSPKFQCYLDGSAVGWQPIPRSVTPSELGLLQTRKEQQSNDTSLKGFREASKDPMAGVFLDSRRFHLFGFHRHESHSQFANRTSHLTIYQWNESHPNLPTEPVISQFTNGMSHIPVSQSNQSSHNLPMK
jgi:hypothetical protein